jgi:catechol 2,3 dioxygenase
LDFLKNLLGLEETERSARSAYLRGYEEQYHHSLKVSKARRAGLGHVAWRVRTRQALQRRVTAIEATGLGRGWSDGDLGHGTAYQFETPEGHRMELFWDVDYVTPPAGKETPLRNRPQKRPSAGAPVCRIDHVNLFAAKRERVRDFLVDILGFRERERVIEDDGSILASFLSVTNLSHDIAMVPEPTDIRGRLHHVCFHYTSVQHVFDAAELAKESGLVVEFGPGRHGIGGATFVYILEPGGNRIELMGDPGYMIFDPTWRTVVWNASEFPNAAAWTGSPPPDSFLCLRHPIARGASRDSGSGTCCAGMITNLNSVATVPQSKGDDAMPAGATRRYCGHLPIVEGAAGGRPTGRATACSGPARGAQAAPHERGEMSGGPFEEQVAGLSPFCRIPSLAVFHLQAERRAVDEASRTASRLD